MFIANLNEITTKGIYERISTFYSLLRLGKVIAGFVVKK